MLLSFEEWLAKQEESSAFTRWRKEAALGLKPPISPAAIHSHSTAPQWIVDKLSGKKKKKKKKAKAKPKAKKKLFAVTESKKPPVKHKEMDSFLNAISDLKKDIDDAKKKAKTAPKEKVGKDGKPEPKSGEKPKNKCSTANQAREARVKAAKIFAGSSITVEPLGANCFGLKVNAKEPIEPSPTEIDGVPVRIELADKPKSDA